MNEIICPACGSKDLVRSSNPETAQLTLGPTFRYEKANFVCNVCGEEGDFADLNDSKFLEAQKGAQSVAVKVLVEHLTQNQDISMAHFERAFELPVRTVTRWKSGDFSASALALLRTVATFPWITEVAANRFNSVVAQSLLIQEAGKQLQKMGATLHIAVAEDNSAIAGMAVFRFSKSMETQKTVSVQAIEVGA